MADMKTLSDGENVFNVVDPNAVHKTGGIIYDTCNFGGNPLYDVGDPTDPAHAANKKYVDDSISKLSGGKSYIDVLNNSNISLSHPRVVMHKCIGRKYEDFILIDIQCDITSLYDTIEICSLEEGTPILEYIKKLHSDIVVEHAVFKFSGTISSAAMTMFFHVPIFIDSHYHSITVIPPFDISIGSFIDIGDVTLTASGILLI